MKKFWFKVLLLVCVMLLPVSVYAAPLTDGIIAIVNNDIITVKDLKDYISGLYRQLRIEHKSEEEIQQTIASYEEKGVNQLIQDKLILAAAKDKGVEVRPQVVDKKLQEIKSKYPSEDDFYGELNSQGLTVTDLKNKIIEQLKAKYIVDTEIRDKVFIKPDEITTYYDQHKEEFANKTKYNLDSIYISFTKGKDEALKRIAEARVKLVAGAEFAKVAKDYSEAASVGVLEEGQMVPAVEHEVFSLKMGDISQPVQVESGVYLFKVNGISQGRMQSLDEVKDDIYYKLANLQFQDKFKAWVDKLRDKAYVEIR